jgi:hypothetical protein
MDGPDAPPSIQKIDAIIALEAEPIIRNLRITQCYHDLSHAIAGRIGAENVNWCTFATWASKTAGRFIRIDEFLPIFRDALRDRPGIAIKIERINKALSPLDASAGLSLAATLQALEQPVRNVSRHITAGNLAVFAELGPLFSVMCSRFSSDIVYNASTLARLLDELELKAGLPEDGGQSLLRSAVSHFYLAKFEPDPEPKAELILLANAETGLHEQIRLQPSIAGSLRLPFGQELRALYERHHRAKYSGEALARLRFISEVLLRPVFKEVDDELNEIWRRCATRLLMQLRLPSGDIELGSDLQASPGQPLFPPPLRTIELDDLRKLLAVYDADGSTARGSGAEDWADILERMHFILTLFRSRQRDGRLFNPPFSPEQRTAISRGQLPNAPL